MENNRIDVVPTISDEELSHLHTLEHLEQTLTSLIHSFYHHRVVNESISE